ncbi:UPF0575 protein C19orf67 homolog [Toxotes jaculatrix]|uniref:UPF0575 protein C19orf67 homolog n=1 Tax=Toxotes jaculatrix TaxID=941984 RepID=UPI001B3AA9D2|nr:UPF0575 protein C19orf67 homolog [Toxotes jaculatrix]
MTDIEVHVEPQLKNSPSGKPVFEGRQQEDMSELNEPLLLLADAALAPPCGDQGACSYDCEACSHPEVGGMERSIQSMRLQLQFLMSKADDLHDCLVNGQGHLDRDALAAAVPSFLFMCQPYFNHLESTARSTMSQATPLRLDIYTRLLNFSQQLCDRLEQLVLTYASHSLLCLDETEPNSMSHFCIGQSRLSQLRLTVFRYCKPVPYLARFDTGLYKRMRWNVEKLRDEWQQQEADEEQDGESEERDEETVGDTEYYFLCYEDIPNGHADADGDDKVVRMWTIGQWVQVNPDPDTEDIYNWIMCEVPQASYHRLLFLGSDEPSSCCATDYLQQLLLSRQTAE